METTDNKTPKNIYLAIEGFRGVQTMNFALIQKKELIVCPDV